MKDKLMNYLISHRQRIITIQDLWYSAKEYYNVEGIEMGGSWASFSDFISVSLNVGDVLKRKQKKKNGLLRFNVSLDEVSIGRIQYKRKQKLKRIIQK